jgi:hypothetical protein
MAEYSDAEKRSFKAGEKAGFKAGIKAGFKKYGINQGPQLPGLYQ